MEQNCPHRRRRRRGVLFRDIVFPFLFRIAPRMGEPDMDPLEDAEEGA
jgi:hypothetical protein